MFNFVIFNLSTLVRILAEFFKFLAEFFYLCTFSTSPKSAGFLYKKFGLGV